jgi:hypothetical protein
MHLGQLLCSLTEHVECSGRWNRISLLLSTIGSRAAADAGLRPFASVLKRGVGRLGKKLRTVDDGLALQVLRNVRKEGTRQAS